MTHKQRILAACRGQVPDRIPWVPRMDLWYKARAQTGRLPKDYDDLSLRELTDALGIGYHAVVPDFRDLRTPEDTVDRALGIYRLRSMPFETRLSGVSRAVQQEGDVTRVVYDTPKGRVSCAFSYTEEMRRAGATIPWITEHAFKTIEDIPTLAYLFSQLEVVPTYDGYQEWHDWVGDAGVAVAYGNSAASPMHHIVHDLAPIEAFFLNLHDYPGRMAALADSMNGWFDQMLSALVRSPAEIIFMGANYDTAITSPRFFEAHILPWLAQEAEAVHRHGKLLLTHTDGENAGLTALYCRSGVDIADSLSPAPLTKLTLAEAIEQLPGITIWGGIPSVALLSSSMGEREFERLVDETVALVSGRTHFILGVADATPPEASLERILAITERVQ